MQKHNNSYTPLSNHTVHCDKQEKNKNTETDHAGQCKATKIASVQQSFE